MNPELMQSGAKRLATYQQKIAQSPVVNTASGGSMSLGRPHQSGELDLVHGRILYLEDVSVSFDGFKAINKLSLDIAPGELRCVIGPNGAGKTTMMDIITGKTRPDEGVVYFGSTINLLRHTEPEIAAMGIGRKFQKPTVFEKLSVFENLELALKTHKDVRSSLFFRLDSEQSDRLDEVLHIIKLTGHVHQTAGNLSHGQKQWLEIGMLLMQDPELLMLDEPIAGMSVRERELTAELLNRICKGRSMIVIEHDMNFVKQIAHKVTVMHQGKILAEGAMEDVQADPRVIDVYLGH